MNKNIYNKRTFFKRFLILSLMLLLLIFISVFLGSANISFIDCIKVILSNIKFLNIDVSGIASSAFIIINKIRLPRVLLAVIIGASISACGATYQTILKCNIVDPFTLGVSSGAAFGATIALILRFDYLLSLFAFLGAIIVSLIVFLISRRSKNKVSLVLIGININYFITALISFLMFFNRETLEKVYFWTMGTLTGANIKIVTLLFLIGIPVITILTLLGKQLNALSIDENYAKSIGINTDKLIKIVIFLVSFLTAFVVSYTGNIGFIGLMVPVITKKIFGNDNRYIIPYSAIIGAMLLVICDAVARFILAPSEIPVGVITSIIGAPVCLLVLLKERRAHE